ncbi:MAG: hypothetical protein K5897_09555 [Eubacterium sp.]|nr:hypothetical protein [Eubacterium sp.]
MRNKRDRIVILSAALVIICSVALLLIMFSGSGSSRQNEAVIQTESSTGTNSREARSVTEAPTPAEVQDSSEGWVEEVYQKEIECSNCHAHFLNYEEYEAHKQNSQGCGTGTGTAVKVLIGRTEH